MATTSLVPPGSIQTPSPAAALTDVSTDALGEAIAGLAARLHAVTYELLVLLREFDSRTDWHGGFASCAHWLHWRTGIALGAAREKVRVAHALATLPLVSAAMQRGAVSYAKVRALTRVATPENEAELLDFAQAGTAAHVERFVGAWRRVDRVAARNWPSRGISTDISRPGWTTTGWSSSAAVSRLRSVRSSSARSRPRPTTCSARRRTCRRPTAWRRR